MANNVKRERFTKIASGRVQKVIDYLNLLQNCANRSNYEYSQEDVDKMFNEMNKALKAAKAAYQKELERNSKTGFTF